MQNLLWFFRKCHSTRDDARKGWLRVRCRRTPPAKYRPQIFRSFFFCPDDGQMEEISVRCTFFSDQKNTQTPLSYRKLNGNRLGTYVECSTSGMRRCQTVSYLKYLLHKVPFYHSNWTKFWCTFLNMIIYL